MFRLINEERESELRHFTADLKGQEPGAASVERISRLSEIIESIRADIPEGKRISLGRYSIIKETGVFIHSLLKEEEIDFSGVGKTLFDEQDADSFIRSLGVQLLSIEAVEKGDDSAAFSTALDYFRKSASDDSWIVRECTAGFIRKLVKGFPEKMLEWYMHMVKSGDPLSRRFACESLRPVAENAWLKKKPDFAWTVLRELFHETDAYPRTSAGNSLSDWIRVDLERTLPVVKELAANGDKNSYWIAYRACRNLVKKDPMLVMDILNTDTYKYKDRRYSRTD